MAYFQKIGPFKIFSLFLLFFISGQGVAQNNPNVPRAAMGNGLYNQNGSNSCLYCHGVGGKGGKVANAADLTDFKSWKIFKVLGGESALAADAKAFKEKFKESSVHLILKGSIVHNSSFKRDWYDISKAGKAYDGQMLGMTAAPSRAWLKKFKKEYNITAEVAAESTYLYLVSLDKSGLYN
jgi:hypothetical protein